MQNHDFCTRKTRFLHRTGPYLSVRNKNRSKLYVSSPPTFFLGGVGVRKQANVEIIPKKYAKTIKWCPYIFPSTVVVVVVVVVAAVVFSAS